MDLEYPEDDLNYSYVHETTHLVLIFKDIDQFNKAASFFKRRSKFFPEEIIGETKSFLFRVQDQNHADILENDLDKELSNNNFYGYYFETE